MPQAELKKAAVLGFPVSHSLSPRLHKYWLKQHRITGSYEAITVLPEDLEMNLRALPEQGFTGVNLTIPHKERALSLMNETDAIAKRIGAVNTVIVKEGRLLGTNTDTYGFMTNLKAEMQDYPVGSALVLGAGGAARAVCAGLLGEGWRVTLAGRTVGKAQTVAGNFDDPIQVTDWERLEKIMESIALLVNATPLGMKGHEPLDIKLDALPRTAWVCDIVYTPEKTQATEKYGDPTLTDFLARAMDRGLPVVGGLGMLLYQAQPAFEAWFGVRPQVNDVLYRYMQEALA